MISLVAEPLLESAPDYESKEMILKLAALAWNFTLLDPNRQQATLAVLSILATQFAEVTHSTRLSPRLAAADFFA